MRIVFTCGGTGGHINPAIAVAKLFRERRPQTEILFAGADDGMEVELVEREGFEIKTVPVTNFRRSMRPKDIKNNMRTVLGLMGAIKRSREILLEFKPDVVVGTGGYASFPTVYAASRLKIPTAIHESNAIPGLTTSLLARRVDKIMVGFEGKGDEYKYPERVVLTGTPVRDEFIFTKKSEARAILKLEDRPLLVSYWGSLGAREMNKMIAQFMRLSTERTPKFKHIHATGSFGWKWMPEYLRQEGVIPEDHPEIDMREYIYDMPLVMAAADLVICRGGASTLNEVLATGTPTIIVPSPNVSGNHQEMNARALERSGGARVRLERDCTGESLLNEVLDLLQDPDELANMSEKLRAAAVPDSAEKIYEILRELASS